MPKTLPRLVHLAVVAQAELVADSEPDFSRLELGEVEPRDTLLVESHVPPHDEPFLGLRLLETLVVVGLDLDERSEDVLVLVRVLVAARPSSRMRGRSRCK